jgi:ubiquinol-cytochrome c reductase cytochrome b subunit
MIQRVLDAIDERLGTAHFVSHALRKAFPDHWSFMLGEINVYAFLVLVATGTFLALFFEPSAAKMTYAGPYTLLDGASVSQAYASALDLSFVVNGGLFVRQVHHWAALLFIAGIALHMGRIFFTGAFRKPRELNWVVGLSLLAFALLAGFSGYSLPDDLLSGTGLRIFDSVVLSIPFAGAWLSSLLLDGSFPSDRMIPRLFVAHVYLIPAVIAALIGLHVAMVWRQKHTQFRTPGRSERHVVGSPLFPNYTVKSLALMFAVVAVTFALGALVQINPVWLWGPYDPSKVISPAQPDWYIGWVEGALRMGPPFALHLWGHTIPSPFWPAVLLPSLIFAVLFAWPWIEARVSGDRARHELLDRPRDNPLRTAVGVAMVVFATGLTLAASDDVQARYAHVPVTALTRLYQMFCIFAPPAAFVLTWLLANDLRSRSGSGKAPRVRLRRNAQGGFDEEALP